MQEFHEEMMEIWKEHKKLVGQPIDIEKVKKEKKSSRKKEKREKTKKKNILKTKKLL